MLFFTKEMGGVESLQKFKEFFTPQEVDVWVSKNYSNEVRDYFDLNKQPTLSPLSLYTGSMSSRINDLLRRGILNNDFTHFEGLQYDLCRNTLPESITVWRYITFKELVHLWKATVFGKTYINPAFVSTTLLRDHFSGQARRNGIVIQIDTPKGTPGVYVKELNNAAIAEYEVLLAHHLAFKRKGINVFEIVPELPANIYRGEYVDKSDYYQPE